MQIMICGSRYGVNSLLVEPQLHTIISSIHPPPIILHGGAKGADKIASDYAQKHGISEVIIKPDYNSYHFKLAPIFRNTELVNTADLVICIWGSGQIKKGGTYDVYKKAIAKNIKVIEILPDGSDRVTYPKLLLF